jgi:pyruvate ferredoxin oxidoreductase gamma subunit
MKEVHVFDGLNPKGLVIINTKKKNIKLPIPGTVKVYTMDATEIGQRNIGKPIPGTAILGAFVKITKLFDLKDVYIAIEKVLKGKYKDIINHNIVAVKEGHDAVKK